MHVFLFLDPIVQDKPVQIRPWKLSDADFVLDASLPLDPRFAERFLIPAGDEQIANLFNSVLGRVYSYAMLYNFIWKKFTNVDV
jgi:hypothetical protein